MTDDTNNAVQLALAAAVRGEVVGTDLMYEAVCAMVSEDLPAVQAGALLATLAARGERMSEILATARVLREQSLKVSFGDTQNLVDTCGTGGTGQSLFNCSTCAALVAAAAGVRVAKHGNRSSTRASGSADLLEAAGVELALNPEQAAECLRRSGMVFLFAPVYHPTMRHMAPVRRALGIRTIFNLVGPLAHPAGSLAQVLGVHDRAYLHPMAETLRELGGRRALVLRSRDGLDEISSAAVTDAVELCADGRLQELEIIPSDFNVSGNLEDLRVQSADESLQMVRQVLGGKEHPAAGMVALNAGAACWMAGRCDSLSEGVELARRTMAGGSGLELLENLAACSREIVQGTS